MLEDFRTRMGDLRQEMDRLTSQAEELERVAQEQQVRLEEMDLLMRQRDEQLSEQQARVEELEELLRQRDAELAELRAHLAEREAALPERERELDTLRIQVAEREAVEAALREELAHAQQAPSRAVEVPFSAFMERFDALEALVRLQGEALAGAQGWFQEEMARLHSRLDRLEAHLSVAPVAVVAPPVAEAPAVPLVVAPSTEVPIAAPPVAAPPAAVEVAGPPPPAAIVEMEPLQALLYEALESLPAAAVIGLAGLDGLAVEMVVRDERAADRPLEIELADLAADAARVTSALGTGPFLTLAFQTGTEQYLVSPVGADHFAFLLTPAGETGDLRRAQAVLLQTVSQLDELL